ncbi:MAG: hypothetical protein JEZ05_06775 [Tenericutes bacterium]|nr:hypothetical protein [Mycoplasmatota bacterium]
MRKVFTVTIALFMVIGAVLIVIFDKEFETTLSILTIKQNYQRLMTEGEKLSLTVYLSSEDSFMTDMNNIDSMYLFDNENEIEVGLSKISYLDYKEKYQDIDYFAYVIDINFSVVSISDFILELENAYLEIHYLNTEVIDLEIGDIYLNFADYVNPSYIDIDRMFGLYKTTEFEYLSAVILGMNNFTGMDIIIKKIETGNKEISLDLKHSIILSDIPDYQADIDDLLGYNYDAMSLTEATDGININENSILCIPLLYGNELTRINRFPLIITYLYNQTEYRYYMDDFQFNSLVLGLEANSGRIREFVYHY